MITFEEFVIVQVCLETIKRKYQSPWHSYDVNHIFSCCFLFVFSRCRSRSNFVPLFPRPLSFVLVPLTIYAKKRKKNERSWQGTCFRYEEENHFVPHAINADRFHRALNLMVTGEIIENYIKEVELIRCHKYICVSNCFLYEEIHPKSIDEFANEN